MKTKSATTAKAAKANPRMTLKSDDYPARMLRRLITLWERWDNNDNDVAVADFDKLIANIKKRMGWGEEK